MTKKRGLGKGLGALIPPSQQPASPEVQAGAVEVPVEHISPNPHQPRQTMNQEKLQDLTNSIVEHGLIQPLIVTQVGTRYQLIAGERRWRASQLAGLTTVPVIVKETSPQQMLELAIVENIQRADLNPLEEAEAYAQLMEEFGLTQEAVAERDCSWLVASLADGFSGGRFQPTRGCRAAPAPRRLQRHASAPQRDATEGMSLPGWGERALQGADKCPGHQRAPVCLETARERQRGTHRTPVAQTVQ